MSLSRKIDIIIMFILCIFQVVFNIQIFIFDKEKTMFLGEKIDAVLMVIVSIVQIIVAIQRRDTLSIVLAILLTISCSVSVIKSYKKGKEREERYRREFDEKYRNGENYLDRD